jgi:hypothetical protein
MTEGTITLSSEGAILYSNRYFAHMMRLELNRVIGASIFDFINPDCRNLVDATLKQDSGRIEVGLAPPTGLRFRLTWLR